MKKILSISILAALAISPMMANAAPTVIAANADPGATNANGPTAANAPKYSTVASTEADEVTAASASYVKGAYNAAIKAINKVSEQAGSDTTALKKGIVSTINHSSVEMFTDWNQPTTKGSAAVRAPGTNQNEYYPNYSGKDAQNQSTVETFDDPTTEVAPAPAQSGSGS